MKINEEQIKEFLVWKEFYKLKEKELEQFYRNGMKRYTQKAIDKRKEERKGFPEFFQKHIQNIKENRLVCKECGGALKGDASEVAHILPKQTFKSVSTEDLNVIYLCGMYSENQCHSKFDNDSIEDVRQMKIFEEVSERFEQLKDQITEKINYKIEDRYGKP